MTKTSHLPLENVLELFVASADRPGRDDLLAFIERYPHYRRELIDFASLWAEQDLIPPAPELDQLAAEQLGNRMASFVENQLYALKAKAEPQDLPASQPTAMAASLRNLTEQAGRSLHDVARAACLDLVLTRKLNARQIRPETIPRTLSQRIADFLAVPLEQILVVWTGPPHLGRASFRSNTKPAVAAQEDFADAVAASSLTADERAALLQD
jgi:hypothetical protein